MNENCYRDVERDAQSCWLNFVNTSSPGLRTRSTIVNHFSAKLDQVQAGTVRLFEAVEKGLLPLDESLQQRIQELKAKKEEVLHGMAEFNRKQEMPIEVFFSPNKLGVLSQAMRQQGLHGEGVPEAAS